jgi:hypothetical protein
MLPRISEGVKQLNNELDNKAKPAEVSEVLTGVTTHVFEGPLYSISQSAAVFQGSLERLALNGGVAPMVFRTYALAAEPTVTVKDENPRIAEYAKAPSLFALKQMMLDDVPTMAPALRNLSNRKITEAINRFLHFNLSLPQLSIESFLADIDDLAAYLGNKFGDAVQGAFLKHQQNLIRSCFELMVEEEIVGWNEQYVDQSVFPEGTVPFIAYPSSYISLTYLNCFLPELGIEMAPKVASLVDSKITPELHEVLASLFDDVQKERKEAFDRHFIVLNDMTVLEAFEGVLVPGSYLLALVR